MLNIVIQLEPGVSQVDARFASRHQPVGKTDQYVNLREVSLRLVLPPGQYAVIPTTFRRGEEGQFLVRLFTERHWGDSDQAAKHTFRWGYTVGLDRVQGGVTCHMQGGGGHQQEPQPRARPGQTRGPRGLPPQRQELHQHPDTEVPSSYSLLTFLLSCIIFIANLLKWNLWMDIDWFKFFWFYAMDGVDIY